MRSILVCVFLACSMACGLPTPAWSADSDRDEDLESLRQELSEARRELAEASRKLGDLYGERYGNSRSFNFSYDGDERPMLGVIMTELGDGRGVKLAGVTPGAPADKAGLESGDVLVSINGEELSGRDGVERAYEALDDMEVGSEYRVVYERDGKRHDTTLVAALHKPSYSFNFGTNFNPSYEFGFTAEQFRDWARSQRDWARSLRNLPNIPEINIQPFAWQLGWSWSGLELAPVNEKLGRYFKTDRGALVIDADGLEDTDLQPGDVILAVNGLDVNGPREVMRRLRKLDPGEQANVILMRDGKQRTVSVTAPEPDENSFSFSWSDDD